MSNEEIYKTSPQASFMSYTAWLEWQNCLVGDYARKLTVEIKKQSTEQNWSEPKPSAIQRLVTQTIIEERKKGYSRAHEQARQAQ